jgi:hypothetical protein
MCQWVSDAGMLLADCLLGGRSVCASSGRVHTTCCRALAGATAARNPGNLHHGNNTCHAVDGHGPCVARLLSSAQGIAQCLVAVLWDIAQQHELHRAGAPTKVLCCNTAAAAGAWVNPLWDCKSAYAAAYTHMPCTVGVRSALSHAPDAMYSSNTHKR